MNKQDRGVGATVQGADGRRRERFERGQILIIAIAATAFFMEQLDSTALNTSIPSIALSLGEAPVRLNVAVTSYILALAAGIPISGWMADRFGARPVFAGAMAVFALASTACGASNSLAMLVATRTVQGLAGSMMSPVGRLLVLRVLPTRQLAPGLTYMAMPAMIGPALGPVIGGALTQFVSWRWIFFINVPVAVIGITMVWNFVPAVQTGKSGRFDLRGYLMCAVGLVAFQFTLENFGRQFVPAWGQVLTAALSAAAFIAYLRHARRTPEPVLGLRVFRRRTFRVAMTAGWLARMGVQAMPFLLPLYFQLALGMEPLQAGGWVALTTIGSFGIRAVVVVLLRHFGFDRLLIWASIYAAATIALFALVDAATPSWVLFLLLIAFGCGRSLQLSSNATLSYSGVPPALLVSANTLSSVVQQLSQSMGVSIAAVLLGLASRGAVVPGREAFSIVFFIVAAFPLLAILGFRRLHPHDGAIASRNPRALAALSPGRRRDN